MSRKVYSNPLITRYASKEMAGIFSDDFKYSTWRRLWLGLAEIQKELGISVSEGQLKDLSDNITNIDYDYIAEIEKKKKHDVMAHIDGFSRSAPSAAPIIHLGATSAFVTDNTDLIQIRKAGRLVFNKLLILIQHLKTKAKKYKGLPILGFTHFQPAQPTTVGKRFCLWLYDLYEDANDLEDFLSNLRFRGTKGTVGTMASYMEIFGLDEIKCLELDKRISERFGFRSVFPVIGQIYPRKSDYKISSILAQIAQSLIKMATDVRLLQHRREIMEPFSTSQVGSSAMPYKQNPMKCERITSLARYLLSKPLDFANIASNQWLERSLDDSAIRRILIPESFLTADAILTLASHVVSGLRVNEAVIGKNLREYMPLLMSEKLIARMVNDGIPRQDAHQKIRDITLKLIDNGCIDNIYENYFQDEILSRYKDFIIDNADPLKHTGTSESQVESFLEECINPLLLRYKDQLRVYDNEHEI